MALRLIGITGSHAGEAYSLESEVLIGRDAACTVVLPGDPGVSRRHARIFWLNGLPMLEDLGSRNGTLMNGIRVSQAMPVSDGYEIRIGAEVFRVEAVIDAPASAPVPIVNVGRERSREGRGRSKRPEQGSAEGSLYGKGTSPGWDPLRGCASLNVDLSGCVKHLWILLILLLIALVLGAIILGIGALASSVASVGSSASGPSATGSSGQGNTPPAIDAQKPPPQEPDQSQQAAPSAEGIHIEEVKVNFAKRGESVARPVVLVKWLNLTKHPVKRLTGTVKLFDKDGKLLVEIPREQIYFGGPISPGEGHTDTIEQGGVVVRHRLTKPPATAQVEVERVE